MHDPTGPAEVHAASTGAAADAPTATTQELLPHAAEDPLRPVAGAPVGRLSSYRRPDTRGSRWRFTGRVEYVSGEQAERLRGELAVVVWDLLAWATDHRDGSDGEPAEAALIEDGEAA